MARLAGRGSLSSRKDAKAQGRKRDWGFSTAEGVTRGTNRVAGSGLGQYGTRSGLRRSWSRTTIPNNQSPQIPLCGFAPWRLCANPGHPDVGNRAFGCTSRAPTQSWITAPGCAATWRSPVGPGRMTGCARRKWCAVLIGASSQPGAS